MGTLSPIPLNALCLPVGCALPVAAVGAEILPTAMPILLRPRTGCSPALMFSLSVLGTALLGVMVFLLLTRHSRCWLTDPSPTMSPDTVSSTLPRRPIRPLPKRRLRDRLSPEVADTLKCPTSTHQHAPLFYYPPYTAIDETSSSTTGPTSPASQTRRNELGRNYTPRRNALRLSDGEEEPVSRSTLVTRSPPEILIRANRRSSRPNQARHVTAQPPVSATFSVDAYDLENTNNKKKRKIPSPSDLLLSGTHALNHEISSLAISSRAQSPGNEGSGESPQSQAANSAPGTPTTSNQGMSGPGRGRLGRPRNGRSPLRALSDGNNSWTLRTSKVNPQWASSEHESSGIISNAIANAEKLGPQGQENVSLLQQHTAGKTTPASTQFTFTCDSQVPGTVRWPGNSSKQNMATQTQSNVPPLSAHGTDLPPPEASSKAGIGRPGTSRRRERRRLERELNVAARHRRQLAAEKYEHNPPKPEDIWICEFCEYEGIFGEPPRALIRDYEMKDRRHRREEADRKRLLEKAKAKSRKARKNGKSSARGTQAPAHDQVDFLREPGAPPMETGNSHSTHSEGPDYGDGFEEEYPDPPPEVPPDIQRPGQGLPAQVRV
ncbi:hypothetical protein BGZ63DRAFT_154584 [Mariannaea sp. PMI_226]|nr:hypothetical protein BGZ63DRAFT_154584 [Mariannaea sp. PMI_226]